MAKGLRLARNAVSGPVDFTGVVGAAIGVGVVSEGLSSDDAIGEDVGGI